MFQKAYAPKKRVKIDTGKSLTEQSAKKQCDMNYILRNYQKTGIIQHAKQNAGRYDDYTVQDFTEAMNIVASTKSMFENLPSSLRNRFENKPEKFLEFVHNPANRDEMEKLGMLKGNDAINANGQPINTPVEPTPEPILE